MEKFYLAAPWEERKSTIEVACEIENTSDLKCCSGWLDTAYSEKKNGYGSGELQKSAVLDVEDVRECDVLIALCDGKGKGHGGRHAEFGMALVLGKKLILVGKPEHVFHYHPRVIQVWCRDELAEAVRRMVDGVRL